VQQLQEKGIHLVSSNESIDTNTAIGKLMLTMIGAINTFEREGIAIAMENGVYMGRQEITYPENWIEIYSKYKTRLNWYQSNGYVRT